MGVVDGSSSIEETQRLFLTDGEQLSLRLLASIADDSYGFVVEISTMYIPEQSNPDLGSYPFKLVLEMNLEVEFFNNNICSFHAIPYVGFLSFI